MHVLLDDDRGRLTVQRLRPWHRELASGASPEASAALAARATRLTSMEFRRGLAASLQRILAATGQPAVPRPLPAAGRSPLPATGRSPLPATGRSAQPATGRSAQPATGRSPLVVTPRAPLAVTGRPPRVPLRLARISRSAPQLAALAGQLVEPGPVPARGVAMLSQLLADGTGPLYREASRDDLGAIVERTARALTL